MAKTTTKSPSKPSKASAPSKSSATSTAKRSKASETSKTAARKTNSKPRQASSSESSANVGETAVDALLKLLESPLVADLLAVGATAALSAVAESRLKEYRRIIQGDVKYKSGETRGARGSSGIS